jgi:hypothetical protein
MTVEEFRASDGAGFRGLCLRFGGMRRGTGRRRMRRRRMLRGRMALGCTLICIARRVMWVMRLIGTGDRDGKWRHDVNLR